MRTTVRLDEQLLGAARRLAAETGRTLTAVIEEALRESLARRRQAKRSKKKVRLPTDGEGGLRPGVDLDDGAGLLDLMEDR